MRATPSAGRDDRHAHRTVTTRAELRRHWAGVCNSGAGGPGRCHIDVPYVVSWQIHGTKECNGRLDPYRWAPLERALDPAWRQALTTYRTG